jgi:hypothetical protein
MEAELWFVAMRYGGKAERSGAGGAGDEGCGAELGCQLRMRLVPRRASYEYERKETETKKKTETAGDCKELIEDGNTSRR